MKRLLPVIILFFSTAVIGADSVATDVRMVGVLDTGMLFVEFPIAVGDPECSQSQLRIANDHPSKDSVLAIALAAYTTGTRVQVKPGGCLGSHPSLVTSGYIHLIRK